MRGGSGLQLTAVIEGNLWELMANEVRAGERAVSISVRSAAQALKGDWRSQIAGSGLGSRLANAVRAEVYPASRPSLNAGALVYSKAPKIVAAHDSGAVIKSANGFWLAIPLPVAGKSGRRGRMSPAEWEARTGRRLRFVYRGGRSALLVDDGTTTGRRVMDRKGFHKSARGFKNRTVPIFVLVPQVKLRKRIDLYPPAERIAATIPGSIVANWRS